MNQEILRLLAFESDISLSVAERGNSGDLSKDSLDECCDSSDSEYIYIYIYMMSDMMTVIW